MTFGELAQAYLQALGTKPSRKKYEQIFNQVFKSVAWRQRPAAAVSRVDILLLHQCMEGTPAHANKSVGFVKQVYNWGRNRIDITTRRAVYDGPNPAQGIRGYSCLSRERLADRQELTILLNDLDSLSPYYQALFGLRFLVPCRITELCKLRRDAVEPSGKWAKGKTKNGRTHYALIPRQGMELLRALTATSPYYFPGCYDRPLQEGSARKVWERWRAKLSLSHPSLADLQMLDMRRVYASYLYTIIKADELFVKAALNHYDPRPLAIYTRLNYDHMAEIGQQYADWMWSMRLETQEVPYGAHQLSLLADSALPALHPDRMRIGAASDLAATTGGIHCPPILMPAEDGGRQGNV